MSHLVKYHVIRSRWTQWNRAFVFRVYSSANGIGHDPDPPTANFVRRHVGPSIDDMTKMLEVCGYTNFEELVSNVIPNEVRLNRELKLDEPLSESALLSRLEKMMNKNQTWRSYIGQGYYGTITPTPILRNIYENPGWYTAYTAYQPEISQGRLEATFHYQTMVSDLTGLPVANASLLDEGTAAAEAMMLAVRHTSKSKLLLDSMCHPQTIAVVKSRASGCAVEVEVIDFKDVRKVEQLLRTETFAGCLTQYPDTEGNVCREKVANICEIARKHKSLTAVATDLLALTLIRSVGELNADFAVGSSQRFGVPMGFGGPHAAFFATREKFVRMLPGRIVGLSRDINGRPAMRLALQVREQHIRRDKATSNICTAQALLATMAAFYAIYHGPKGLSEIATRIHRNTVRLAATMSNAGYEICNEGPIFDTVKIRLPGDSRDLLVIKQRASQKRINLRYPEDNNSIVISLDETVTKDDFEDILYIFNVSSTNTGLDQQILEKVNLLSSQSDLREDSILSQPVFNSYHSETELLRYMKQLENKDFSLVHSMIPLGSCTMKLSPTTAVMPGSWPSVNRIHPLAPTDQTEGYAELITALERDLVEITGYDHVCMTPNSGAQGEYAGLRAIAGYLGSKGEFKRKICLIPTSAHGTNPASARLAGMTVQPINVTKRGAIDMGHLKEQVDRFKDTLAAIMITYPTTFGVFDENILNANDIVHQAGGQVYLDGANLNAQVGLCRPGDYNTDVAHLNLHKTFGIPKGGGGPGVGPVCVKAHLVPFIPQHYWRPTCFGAGTSGHTSNPDPRTVCSAPFGSASLLPIPWSYIRLMGPKGLRCATEVAILNANYMLRRLKEHYPIKFVNNNGCCAHEFIIDCSGFEKYRITTLDVAKRLIDYGFHSPTMSWPVPSGLMLEPTESESKGECDRLCDALIGIRQEIEKIARGEWCVQANPLKLAPHTIEDVTSETWDRPYTRQEAAFPAPWQRSGLRGSAEKNKLWPSVGRLDDAYGDTHLVFKNSSSTEVK